MQMGTQKTNVTNKLRTTLLSGTSMETIPAKIALGDLFFPNDVEHYTM